MTRNAKTVGIVQARLGSTRLPGKVLTDIHGQPMLWRVLQRVQAAETIEKVIVATTTKAEDEAILTFCREYEVGCFRGSEEDVLDRYYQAAHELGADVIVRITSDCPLIDPGIVDRTVRAFLREQPDYASNAVVRTYPRGLDTEAMTFAALERAWQEAKQSYQRVHVTPYLYENPERFRILSLIGEKDYSDYRWTVDTREDLEFVRAVYARLGDELFPWSAVIQLLEREPELAEMNRSVAQKAIRAG